MPGVFSSTHFVVCEETSLQLMLKRVSIDVQSHHRERLPAVSERLLPFAASAYRHFGFARLGIARRPPTTGGSALKLRSRQIKAANFVHSSREPEKALRPKHSGQSLLQQRPQSLRMKWPAGVITECCDSVAAVGGVPIE